MGLMVALLMELLRRRVRGIEDLSSLKDLPLVGVINAPVTPGGGRLRLLSLRRSSPGFWSARQGWSRHDHDSRSPARSSAKEVAAAAPVSATSSCEFSPSSGRRFRTLNSKQAEAIRAIRTHVMAQHIDRGRRALAICAPNRGVGCTFVAANLAVALCQIGVKTVLVDGDLHNPSVSNLIRPASPRSGISECLVSQGPFSECIDFEVAPNLSVMLAGRSVQNSRELLAGERFQMLMDFCLRDFRHDDRRYAARQRQLGCPPD